MGKKQDVADLAELEEAPLKRTLKDLFAGAVSGVAQVLLGQLESRHILPTPD